MLLSVCMTREDTDYHLHMWQVFKELFDAVIDEKHLGFSPNDKQPSPELEPENVRPSTLRRTAFTYEREIKFYIIE